ncbi:MAG: DUF4214 domain-containing protein [Betaproteobacteria bacterium]|nr:DUF4214 domain-containing protein [Betaproteobacteria bacterium]
MALPQFIQRAYRAFFSRPADAVGFNCWSIRRLALVPALMFLSAFSLPALALDDDFIQKAYIAFFNRPADAEGFNYWRNNYHGPEQELLDLFAQSDEYRSDFAGKSNREIIAIVYQNLFGRAPETDGWNYWETQMNAGWVTVANVAYEVLGGAQSTDLTTIINKTTVAQAFTNALYTQDEIDAYAKAGVNGVGDLAKNWLATVSYSDNTLNNAQSNLNSVLTTLVEANHGGGSGDASIAACSSADRTVSYAVTGDDVIQHTVGPMTYNGQAVIGFTQIFSSGYTFTSYQTVTNSGVYVVATEDSHGVITTFSPNPHTPLSIQPGQSFDQHYTLISSAYGVREYAVHTTFVGFETLTLAGKTFSNVCHFIDSSTVDGMPTESETWNAPGYGLIKSISSSPYGTISSQYAGDL